MTAFEYNFDGLIGPTHNYSGLAYGNVPSLLNRFTLSQPKRAALQGLKKIRLLNRLGVKQAIMPPHVRPNMEALHFFGYKGKEKDILEKVSKENFDLLLTCSSSSPMWTANAATISPSTDTGDKKFHITPANLSTLPHRRLEVLQTLRVLSHIFFHNKNFIIHPPLPYDDFLCDEGAANHMRLSSTHGESGLEIFVYGKSSEEKIVLPEYYPARQSKEASQIIALTHQIPEDRVIYVQQNPRAIDLGVFHNDLIAVSNENVLLYHEMAFANTEHAIKEIKKVFKSISKEPLYLIEIKEDQLKVSEAVRLFFFNSQIVTLENHSMTIIAPGQCRDKVAKKLLIDIVEGDNPIKKVYFVNLKQSMLNGGGPACLRLRLVLTDEEKFLINKNYLLNDEKIDLIENWIRTHYRDKLHINDLKDYKLLRESRVALDELTQMLQLGNIYSFQSE